MHPVSRFMLTFLFNSLWQVTLIAAVAWACSAVLHRAPSRYLHRLWTLALILAFLLPLWSALGSRMVDRPRSSMGIIVMSHEFSASQGPRAEATRRFPPAVSLAPFWLGALSSLYWIVLLSRAVWMIRTWLAGKKLSETAKVVEPPSRIMAIFAGSGADLGMSTVSFLRSSVARSPLTFGLWKHKIVLPEAVLRLAGDEDWASIALHEMAHIRRHDFLKNLIYELLCWPIGFHPAAVAVRRQIGRTRELACDEMAAEWLASPSGYARSLVNVARMMSGVGSSARPNYGLGISDANILEERIMKLLHHDRRLSLPRARTLLALAFSILAVLSVSVAALAVLVTEKTGNTAKSAAAESTSGAPGQQDKIFEVGSGVIAPRPISTPDPAYPKTAPQGEDRGVVTLAIVIGADGKVHNLQVLSSTRKEFEETTLSTVKHWTFDPATRQGRPVAVKIKVEVSFQRLAGVDKSSLLKQTR